MIKVVYYEVRKPGLVTEIDGSLASMQKLVGGSIEHLDLISATGNANLNPGLGIYLDEEGKYKKDALSNFDLGFDILVGNVFVAAHDDAGEMRSLTDAEIENVREALEPMRVPR